MVNSELPSCVKENITLVDSTVECAANPPDATTTTATTTQAVNSPSGAVGKDKADVSGVQGTKRATQDSADDNVNGDTERSSESNTAGEDAEKNVHRGELFKRRRVKASLGTIDTTFNLADFKGIPAPNSTPRSIGQIPRSENSEDDLFFQEKKTPSIAKHMSMYEKGNPFKSSLSIRIPKSPAKPNPYAGQSPMGNPFVLKSPYSTCSSNSSSKVSPRSSFNYPSSINSTSSSPRPTFNGFLDLRSKTLPSMHVDDKQKM